MTTELPPAGWYPDPSGKPGQMYWDGQRWQQAIPATTPPAAGPTPWDKVRPHVDKARPHWDKGRRFWSGLSRERKVIFALAGLLVVVAVIAVPVAAFDYLFGGFAGGHSADYQAGYQYGTSGAASKAAGYATTDAQQCDSAYSSVGISSHTSVLPTDDWMQAARPLFATIR